MYSAIEIGNKVELVTDKKPNQEQKKYFSVVNEVTTNEGEKEIVIQAPLVEGRIIPLEMNKRYGLCVYTEKGLYRTEVEVVGRFKEDNLYFIVLNLTSDLQKYQRRQFYRMDCMLSFHYKDDSEPAWQEGTILDMSGGGIRFISKEMLTPKKGIINHLKLQVGDQQSEVYVSGVIIASDSVKHGEKVYENRVEFDNISNEVRETIIKFIFEEERKRRSSGRRV